MRLLIQRVLEAKVLVDGQSVGAIGPGALVFLGVHHKDHAAAINYLVEKLIHLRMFHDAEEKMNLSLLDVKGSVLIVSQFTLYADCTQGRRPSFTDAAPPAQAKELYEKFVAHVRQHIGIVETGIFGAKMEVHLINDGPITFIVDSKN